MASIQDRAKAELAKSSIPVEEQKALLHILKVFFIHWDSGGAVAAMAPVLMRLIAGKPLSPLTGADGEWLDTGGVLNGQPIHVNARCGSVYRQAEPDGTLRHYDIDTGGAPLRIEKFPYMPERAVVPFPVFEVGK